MSSPSPEKSDSCVREPGHRSHKAEATQGTKLHPAQVLNEKTMSLRTEEENMALL